MDAFIDIYCRIRHTKYDSNYHIDSSNEENDKLSLSVSSKDRETVNNKKEIYSFKFNKIFDRFATQQEIFDHITRPSIVNVINGYNCTVFAYGQTGSGKTFTITGGPEKFEDRGIIPRCLDAFFSELEKIPDSEFSMKISYMEIYNEVGYDLLQFNESAKRLEDLNKIILQDDNSGQFHLKGLSYHPARSVEDALNLLFIGDTNRTIAETPMNDASTRSHCIFSIHISSKQIGKKTFVKSKFHLVDLAGSERVSKCKLSGVLLKEAKYINRSLHHLEHVILSLSNRNSKHIPYRNSMLTSVLKDSLGGNCKTVMIANISVDRENIQESISTCKFSQRVALIQNMPVVNEIEGLETVDSLKMEIHNLKSQLAFYSTQEASVDSEKCRNVVEKFVDGQEIPFNIVLNGKEIEVCLSSLKKKCKTSQDSSYIACTDTGSLKELVKQRDSEISILVGMLKKERTNNQKQLENGNSSVKAAEVVENNGDQLIKQRKTLMDDMSEGQREIFEIYKKDGDDYSQIVEKQNSLRDLFTKAKTLGADIFKWKEEITELKKQIKYVTEEGNLEKVNCLHQELHKKTTTYNKTLTELKSLKQETEHSQFILEKLQIKLLRNFNNWWQLNHKFYENQRQSITSTDSNTSKHIFPEKTTNSIEYEPKPIRTESFHKNEIEQIEQPNINYSEIPLTGDKEVDDDIQAFIKARAQILSRK